MLVCCLQSIYKKNNTTVTFYAQPVDVRGTPMNIDFQHRYNIANIIFLFCF